MGWGSNDFQAGMSHAAGMSLADSIGQSFGAHFRKKTAQASKGSEMTMEQSEHGQAGIKVEALRELARYNPTHPLLNRAYRERLFDKYAYGKLEVPPLPDSPLAQDPDAK